MSDELRVPPYVVDMDALYEDYERRRVVTLEEFMTAHDTGDLLIFRSGERLNVFEAEKIKARIRAHVPNMPFLLTDSRWTVESIDAAAQRAYSAFWGVLGPVSEQWAVMSEERKDCWRGVVRAVLDV